MKPEMLYLLLFPFLGIMAVSDLRRRQVGVVWLLLFGAVSLAVSVVAGGWHGMASNLGHNAMLLAYMFAGVSLYLWIRHRRDEQPRQSHLDSYIGMGDIVFMVAITPLFPLPEFLMFLVVSLLATLAGWGVWRLSAKRRATIPLVSALGVCLCCYLTAKMALWP